MALWGTRFLRGRGVKGATVTLAPLFDFYWVPQEEFSELERMAQHKKCVKTCEESKIECLELSEQSIYRFEGRQASSP